MNAKKRVNIIDLLVIVVALVAMLVVGASKLAGESSVNGENKKIVITFYSEEVSESIADHVKDGDTVSDSTTDVVFGKAKVETGESVSYIATDKNEYIKASRNGYRSITIKCETNAVYSDIGVVYDDNIYGVGHTLTLLAGDARFTARVKDIEIVEE